MEPFGIAAACTARGLTPAETKDVETALIAYLGEGGKTPNAGQAQRLLEAAINNVLMRSRRVTVFDVKPAAPDDPTKPDAAAARGSVF